MEVDAVGEQLLALWGREGLRCWTAEAVSQALLPASSKRLLVEYGLPEVWPNTGAVPAVTADLPRVDTLHTYYRVVEKPATIDHGYGF